MPRRLAKLAATLTALGFKIEKPGKSGHWKIRRRDGQMYPVPAHKGLKSEIPDVYIRGLSRFSGVSFEVLSGRKPLTDEVIRQAQQQWAPK